MLLCDCCLLTNRDEIANMSTFCPLINLLCLLEEIMCFMEKNGDGDYICALDNPDDETCKPNRITLSKKNSEDKKIIHPIFYKSTDYLLTLMTNQMFTRLLQTMGMSVNAEQKGEKIIGISVKKSSK